MAMPYYPVVQDTTAKDQLHPSLVWMEGLYGWKALLYKILNLFFSVPKAL
jgi:hypothetical protein